MTTQPIAETTGTAIAGLGIDGTSVSIGRITDGPFSTMYDLIVKQTEDEQVHVIITREAMWGLVSSLLDNDAQLRAAVVAR